jgi:hypothetical protein
VESGVGHARTARGERDTPKARETLRILDYFDEVVAAQVKADALVVFGTSITHSMYTIGRLTNARYAREYADA